MSHFRVGTRRGFSYPEDGPVPEFGAHWVEVDGQRIPSDHLLSVDYHADGEGVNTVTLIYSTSSFETVDKDAEPETTEVDEVLLTMTTDAVLWAAEFAKVCPHVDQGLMVGWFANAIEVAKSEARRGDPADYLVVRAAVSGAEPAEDIIRRLRDRQ